MLTLSLKAHVWNPSAWEVEGGLDFRVACEYAVSSSSYTKGVGATAIHAQEANCCEFKHKTPQVETAIPILQREHNREQDQHRAMEGPSGLYTLCSFPTRGRCVCLLSFSQETQEQP